VNKLNQESLDKIVADTATNKYIHGWVWSVPDFIGHCGSVGSVAFYVPDRF
jgi:hypothetical protein